MGKQYTLKVYPAGMSRTAYRVIQISGKETLDRLCSVIISSFDFIDEHLYEFCMDNRMYERYMGIICEWLYYGSGEADCRINMSNVIAHVQNTL